MIHRLRTGSIRNRKLYIFESHWRDMDDFRSNPHVGQYEDLFKNKQRLAPSLVVENLTQAVDEGHFSPHIKVNNSSKVGTAFTEELLLDYSFGDFAVVTAAFKELVEDLDPGVHQFVPCTLLWGDALDPIDVPLYRFICGRIVALDTKGVKAWGLHSPEAKRFSYPKPQTELKYLATLSQRPDCYASLQEFPLWTFKRMRAEKYISDAFLSQAKARELKGFELSTKNSARDVTDVSLAPSIEDLPEKNSQPKPKSKIGLFKRVFRQ